MNNMVLTKFLAALIFISLLAGCGGGSSRNLLSISINPLNANGANSPLGGVQFVATGTFNKAPTTVTPLSATWAISPSGIASIETSDGFAQCEATGTATITASAPVSAGSSGVISSTAMLTC